MNRVKWAERILAVLFVAELILMVVGLTGIIISLPLLDILPAGYITPFVMVFAGAAVLLVATEHGGDEIIYRLKQRELKR